MDPIPLELRHRKYYGHTPAKAFTLQPLKKKGLVLLPLWKREDTLLVRAQVEQLRAQQHDRFRLTLP